MTVIGGEMRDIEERIKIKRAINSIMDSHGLTQQQVADMLDIEQGTLSKALNCKITLGGDKVVTMLELFPEEVSHVFLSENIIVSDKEKSYTNGKQVAQ